MTSTTRTVISGGTVVTATGRHRHTVVVEGERIVALLAEGSDDDAAARGGGATQLDATGRYVLPGGVDVHTHMELRLSTATSSDTFETGTRAAAWGGTTTIIDFAQQNAGETLRDAWEQRQQRASGQCAIDYGLHMVIADVNADRVSEMAALHDDGVTSFKLFTAYPGSLYSTDAQIFRVMQKAGQLGSIVMMHCENGIVIDELIKDHLARGETDPIFHSMSRPEAMEAEATHRCIQIAKVAGSPLYVVHLSADEALEQVMIARDRGQNVFAETCPQYLYRSIDDLARTGLDGLEGANFVCSTPLRHEQHQQALWRGLRQNDLSVVSTDHCPFCFKEQKELGRGDFSKIPNGIAGVEHRMDLLYQGVHNGHLTLERFVEVCSTTPARMFGLYGRKGVVAPGADADLVIYDPGATQTLGVATHHMAVDYSAYEGITINGRCETVMSRGALVIDRGSYVGRSGHGNYLKRAASQYLN
jgi:dihydropyrimidinase